MIAVIGGSGFIGTRLCEILRESGVDFRIIDKQMSRYFPDQTEICDVRDIEGLIRATRGASTIINLAAEHRDDVTPRSLYDEVNVQGAENVCECAVANGIPRIVFTSSVAVYGLGHTGIDESGEGDQEGNRQNRQDDNHDHRDKGEDHGVLHQPLPPAPGVPQPGLFDLPYSL